MRFTNVSLLSLEFYIFFFYSTHLSGRGSKPNPALLGQAKQLPGADKELCLTAVQHYKKLSKNGFMPQITQGHLLQNLCTTQCGLLLLSHEEA